MYFDNQLSQHVFAVYFNYNAFWNLESQQQRSILID